MTDCSKIRTRWKVVIIFNHPRLTLVLDRRPGNRAAILQPEIHRHGSHGCSHRRCSVRAFNATRRRGRRLSPREDPPRRVTLQHSLQLGMNSRPPSRFLECKIAARLFRRCPQRVRSRIMPDSLCSSTGAALRRPHNHQLRTAIVNGSAASNSALVKSSARAPPTARGHRTSYARSLPARCWSGWRPTPSLGCGGLIRLSHW